MSPSNRWYIVKCSKEFWFRFAFTFYINFICDSKDNVLILNCDEDRSQLKNKTTIIKRFLSIIEKGLHKPKTRKATKTPKSVKEKRLHSKKVMSALKQNRKKPNF